MFIFEKYLNNFFSACPWSGIPDTIKLNRIDLVCRYKMSSDRRRLSNSLSDRSSLAGMGCCLLFVFCCCCFLVKLFAYKLATRLFRIPSIVLNEWLQASLAVLTRMFAAVRLLTTPRWLTFRRRWVKFRKTRVAVVAWMVCYLSVRKCVSRAAHLHCIYPR